MNESKALQVRKAINIYCPEFIIEKIKFFRYDTGYHIYDVYGEMTEQQMFNVYPFHSIKAIVIGKTVIKYRIIISDTFFKDE